MTEESTRPALLAIDGGNSKIDVAVVAADGRVLSTARAAGFKPQSAGVDVAVDVLSGAVTAALERAGAAEVSHIAAYLAGADFPSEEEILGKALLARGWARTVQVGNDTFALLRVGAEAGWGVAVVCGAGINCVGVGPDGTVSRFASLGTLTGDWGGGASLGEAALYHAVRDEDGRGPATALTAAVAAHFGVATALDVSMGVHAGEIRWEQLLGLTPVLFDAAEAGDEVARAVSDRQAEEVAILGTVTLRRLGLLDAEVDVVLGGGVLRARRLGLMEAIEKRYAELAPRARLVVADAPPVLGAALLGLDHLEAPAETHATLRATHPG